MGFVYKDGTTGEDIQPLVPDEQARVKELREQGIVEELFLAADRSRGWFVMQGDSEDAIREATASLPLFQVLGGDEHPHLRRPARLSVRHLVPAYVPDRPRIPDVAAGS